MNHRYVERATIAERDSAPFSETYPVRPAYRPDPSAPLTWEERRDHRAAVWAIVILSAILVLVIFGFDYLSLPVVVSR